MYKKITKELVLDMAHEMKHMVMETGGKGIVVCISGGKDSTVVAGLAKLTGLPVLGVLLPNGVQKDISDSRTVVETLGIQYKIANIKAMYDAMIDEANNGEGVKPTLTEQALINLAPRLRMAAGYFFSQCYGYRVMNTCNMSETMVGYETRWGDAVGDYAPLAQFTVKEVLEIGDILVDMLGLPTSLIHKTPSDGLCGKSDEDNLGLTYAEIDNFLLNHELPKDQSHAERLDTLIQKSEFKRQPIPYYHK